MRWIAKWRQQRIASGSLDTAACDCRCASTTPSKELATEKALINIKNDDDRCFLYSLLCGMLHASGELPEHPERVSVYKKFASGDVV